MKILSVSCAGNEKQKTILKSLSVILEHMSLDQLIEIYNKYSYDTNKVTNIEERNRKIIYGICTDPKYCINAKGTLNTVIKTFMGFCVDIAFNYKSTELVDFNKGEFYTLELYKKYIDKVDLSLVTALLNKVPYDTLKEVYHLSETDIINRMSDLNNKVYYEYNRKNLLPYGLNRRYSLTLEKNGYKYADEIIKLYESDNILFIPRINTNGIINIENAIIKYKQMEDM